MSTILVANTPHSAALLIPAIAEQHPNDGPVVSIADDQLSSDVRAFDLTPLPIGEPLPKLQSVKYRSTFVDSGFAPRRETTPIALDEFIDEVSRARNVYIYGQGAGRIAYLYHATRVVRSYNPHARIMVIEEHTFSVPASREAVRTAYSSDDLQPAFDAVAISDHFHFNYQLNSEPLLAAAFTRHGLKRHPRLTPFGLQFLLWAREMDCGESGFMMSEEAMQTEVARWEGTGRFPLLDAAGRRITLDPIRYMEDPAYQLIIAGLLTTANGEYSDDEKAPRVLTPGGRSLADEFDDSCHDPDLPFRIVAWKALGKERAFGEIETYLLSFFSGWHGVRQSTAVSRTCKSAEI